MNLPRLAALGAIVTYVSRRLGRLRSSRPIHEPDPPRDQARRRDTPRYIDTFGKEEDQAVAEDRERAAIVSRFSPHRNVLSGPAEEPGQRSDTRSGD
jgi:hypothetical protein